MTSPLPPEEIQSLRTLIAESRALGAGPDAPAEIEWFNAVRKMADALERTLAHAEALAQ
jgi:hypothetical protein